MKNEFKKVIKNYKILFCYFLIIIAVLMLLLVIITKPQKSNKMFLYNTGLKSENTIFYDKVEQYIYSNVDMITALNIDVGSKSFENLDFNIKVSGANGEIYFDNDVSNYESTIFYISLGYLANMKNKTLKITISCKEKCLLNLKTNKSFDSKTYIINNNDRTLNISVDTMIPNKGYYWYPAMIIMIAFLLLPYARSDKNEE